MNDTKELRRLAQAATAGEWYVERGNHIYGRNEVTDKEEVWHPVIACTDDDEINVNFEANAAFIAAANPAAISELLDRLEAAEKSDAESLAMYRKARDERDALRVELNEIRYGVAVAHDTIKALRAALQHETDCVEAAKAEIEALRAKITEMEKQEPARLVTPTAYRWRYRGAVKWQYGELTEETVRRAKEHNHEVQPLYALPGAQTQGEEK